MSRSRYRVCYKAKGDGDTCKVWVYADTPSEAEREARREYWDIASIVYVEKL